MQRLARPGFGYPGAMREAQPPFHFHIEKISPELYGIKYAGFLGEHDVEIIERTERILADTSPYVGLYCEASQMVGFHRSQVSLHGNLYLRYRPKLIGLAITGASPTIRFGAITVGLVARMPIKTFDAREQALGWLATMRARKG